MQIHFHISALAVTARFVAIIYLTGPLLNAAPARREIYEPTTAPAASSAQTGELTAVLDGGIGSIDVRYPPEGKVEGQAKPKPRRHRPTLLAPWALT